MPAGWETLSPIVAKVTRAVGAHHRDGIQRKGRERTAVGQAVADHGNAREAVLARDIEAERPGGIVKPGDEGDCAIGRSRRPRPETGKASAARRFIADDCHLRDAGNGICNEDAFGARAVPRCAAKATLSVSLSAMRSEKRVSMVPFGAISPAPTSSRGDTAPARNRPPETLPRSMVAGKAMTPLLLSSARRTARRYHRPARDRRRRRVCAGARCSKGRAPAGFRGLAAP